MWSGLLAFVSFWVVVASNWKLWLVLFAAKMSLGMVQLWPDANISTKKYFVMAANRKWQPNVWEKFFPWSCGKMGPKLNLWSFLDHQLWPEESYELGSVPLSFHPSIRKNSACVAVDDTAGFFEKKFLAPKNGPKIGFFEFIGKFRVNLVCEESLYYLHLEKLSMCCCGWHSWIFWKKISCSKNGPKIGFFEFIGKFRVNLVCEESLYYLHLEKLSMCCCGWHSWIFWKKISCSKNGPKIGFFEFIGKFCVNLVCKESLYYLLYSCTNLVRGENLVPEIWAKILSSNQIARFLNWLYL